MFNPQVDNYQATVVNQQRVYTKKHSSLLANSLMITGIGFILMSVIAFCINSWLYNLLLEAVETQDPSEINSTSMILYVVAIVFLIISMIMTIFVSRKIQTVKAMTVIFSIIFFIIAYGIIFGFIFLGLQLDGFTLVDLVWSFAIVGGIFAATGLIGWMLSLKATITLNRFVSIASIIFLVFVIVLWVSSIFTNALSGSPLINSIVWTFAGLLSIVYLMVDFARIKQSQVYISMLESDMQFKYALLFGFSLLSDLVILLMTVLRVMSALRR